MASEFLTDAEVANLRALEAKATPGSWDCQDTGDTQWFVTAPTQHVCNTLHSNDEANARLIAAGRCAAVAAEPFHVPVPVPGRA